MNNKKNCLISIMFFSFIIVSFYHVSPINPLVRRKQKEQGNIQRQYDLEHKLNVDRNGDFSGEHINKGIASAIVIALEADKRSPVPVKVLNFSNCKFDNRQVIRIIKALEGSEITHLDFSGCNLTRIGVTLARILKKTKITNLNLSGNEGMNLSIIIKNLSGTKIENLNLSRNKINTEKAINIIKALENCSIEILDISNQHETIDDSILSVIEDVLPHTWIKILRLFGNSISEKTQTEIDYILIDRLEVNRQDR